MEIGAWTWLLTTSNSRIRNSSRTQLATNIMVCSCCCLFGFIGTVLINHASGCVTIVDFEILNRLLGNGFFIDFVNLNKNNMPQIGNLPKTGILVDLDCTTSKQFLIYAEENYFFSTSNHWLLLTNNIEIIKTILELIFIPPIADVKGLVWNTTWSLYDYYKVAKSERLKEIVIVENSSQPKNLIKALRNYEPAIPKRKNLEGIYLKCGIVVAFPDIFTTLDDLKMRHIDTIAKGNYPIVTNLKDDLNFSYNLIQVDDFGWNRNGTFNGLMGRFQRLDVECAACGIFMRPDRVRIVDFVGETFTIRACVMFRQPPLSAVSNIFFLPFNMDVWYSLLVFFAISTIIMITQVWQSFLQTEDIHYLDCINFVWGAICQQGISIPIFTSSKRILVFTTFITTLFLFTSYSANIVALLQSPSASIKSISDLTHSPLEVGAQDTVYNKVYFKEITKPVAKNLYERKIAPKGESAYVRPNIGIQKMRSDLFAYQVEAHAAYKIISDTFNENEKCGLTELEIFNLPIINIPVRKNFSYLELFKQRLRRQREVGLIKREVLRWIPQKPKCEIKFAGFISVGITECRYALYMLFAGIALSLLIFILEMVYCQIEQNVTNSKINKIIKGSK